MAGQHIDRDKLRAAIRRIGSEYVFHMLDDAITLLPQTKLRKLIAQYLDPAELRPDGARKEDLLADVKAFQKASVAGKYYQAFAVNSKNCAEKSSGTLAWIAEVGVDWKKVLPAWFRALSATAGPSEYVQRIATLLNRHYKRGRVEMLAEAGRMATPAQRQALTKLAFEGSIAGGS